jgi:hypothetical protein
MRSSGYDDTVAATPATAPPTNCFAELSPANTPRRVSATVTVTGWFHQRGWRAAERTLGEGCSGVGEGVELLQHSKLDSGVRHPKQHCGHRASPQPLHAAEREKESESDNERGFQTELRANQVL